MNGFAKSDWYIPIFCRYVFYLWFFSFLTCSPDWHTNDKHSYLAL